jgi:predicted TIM-barrel fold metal-dependent hydrolase
VPFGWAPNDRRFYPLYAKCNELDIAVGMQVGHSAEVLPSEAWSVKLGFPIGISLRGRSGAPAPD